MNTTTSKQYKEAFRFARKFFVLIDTEGYTVARNTFLDAKKGFQPEIFNAAMKSIVTKRNH